MKALNRTHLQLSYIDNVKGAVLDSIIITKSQDAPGFPRA